MSKAFFVLFAGALCIVLIVWLVVSIVLEYQVSRDLNAVLDRAQVAANAQDMLEYLKELRANMEARGFTKGNWAVIFKKPDNSFELHYKVVNRLIERLEQVKDLPQTETTYQVALDDIRGTVRELPYPAWLWVTFHFWMLLWVVVLTVFTIFSGLVYTAYE